MKINDKAQIDLDKAAAKYRRAYNRGLLTLSEQGYADKAQRILDKANKEYNEAKLAFTLARERGK